mgnify:CR=1 FL=1
MSTRRKINYRYQVKEINGHRWICVEVGIENISDHSSYDFIDNVDSRLWKIIRPWIPSDLDNPEIAGQSQYFDDKK